MNSVLPVNIWNMNTNTVDLTIKKWNMTLNTAWQHSFPAAQNRGNWETSTKCLYSCQQRYGANKLMNGLEIQVIRPCFTNVNLFFSLCYWVFIYWYLSINDFIKQVEWVVYFFRENRRDFTPYCPLLQNKRYKKVPKTELRDNEGYKENLRGWYVVLARRITWANSFLIIALQRCTEAWRFMKITSFLTDQIDQHMVTTISMKKGSWSWSLKLSKIWKGPALVGTERWIVFQQASRAHDYKHLNDVTLFKVNFGGL